jgi:hypothetical protein
MIKDNTFAAACYNENTIAELETALVGDADETDMKLWGINQTEWREQIQTALTELKADREQELIPTCLNEIGQAHVAAELTRHGIDWDVSAVCSEIEDGMWMDTIRACSKDTYDYEITNNAASRAGVCQAGYGVFAYIEITADMVQFEVAQ